MPTYTANALSLQHLPGTADARSTWQLRQLIWLYILLVFFEGALRKWFLPGLAAPLLVIRDPVAMLILFNTALSRYHVLNPYTLITFGYTAIAFLLTLAVGHQNLFVDIYGARITLLHFPLIFVFGQVFTREDVLRFGRFMLWIALPMVLLIGLQYFSPQSAWVNRGVGGDVGGAGFSGAMGFFRPPATFSFTNGTTLFFNLLAAFVAYFWIGRKEEAPRLLLLAGSAAVIMAIPLSLSRGYLFQLVVTVLFLLGASVTSGKSLARIGLALVALPPVVMILSALPFFQTSLEVLQRRFEVAAVSEGGLEGTLVNRFLGGMFGAVGGAGELPLWGAGLGIGTNVGSAFLLGARGGFITGEGEWQRMIGELGPILGLIAVFTRLILGLHITLRAVQELFRDNALPLMIMSFGFLQVIYANWAQPTSLGFAIVTGGLAIAAMNRPATDTEYA